MKKYKINENLELRIDYSHGYTFEVVDLEKEKAKGVESCKTICSTIISDKITDDTNEDAGKSIWYIHTKGIKRHLKVMMWWYLSHKWFWYFLARNSNLKFLFIGKNKGE